MGAISFKRMTADGDGGTNRKDEGEPTAIWGKQKSPENVCFQGFTSPSGINPL